MKIHGAWGGQDPTLDLYANVPPHKNGGNLPSGGNEVFCDGHVQWAKAQSMYFFTAWKKDGSRLCYFYQDTQDFEQVLNAALPVLAFKP